MPTDFRDRGGRDPSSVSLNEAHASRSQIAPKWKVIAACIGNISALYPDVCEPHLLALFDALGSIRLAENAVIFATASMTCEPVGKT